MVPKKLQIGVGFETFVQSLFVILSSCLIFKCESRQSASRNSILSFKFDKVLHIRSSIVADKIIFDQLNDQVCQDLFFPHTFLLHPRKHFVSPFPRKEKSFLLFTFPHFSHAFKKTEIGFFKVSKTAQSCHISKVIFTSVGKFFTITCTMRPILSIVHAINSIFEQLYNRKQCMESRQYQ